MACPSLVRLTMFCCSLVGMHISQLFGVSVCRLVSQRHAICL